LKIAEVKCNNFGKEIYVQESETILILSWANSIMIIGSGVVGSAFGMAL
jgi:pyruvate/2-oxoglutarate dehydrogenase complex dihydrolipoamide dehydrogenase (E3) component